jgi:predicted MFS family arabinose efflux permease
MTQHPQRALPLAFGGLLAMAAAMGIGRFVYTPILPFMVEGVGLTKPEAGLIASANFLGYLLGALAAAAPRLPGGQRLWFVGGLAASALTTAAMGLASGVFDFIALRFLGGIASAFVLIFASTLVLDRLASMERPGLSALHFAGPGFGIAFSSLLIAALASAGLGWRIQWLAGAAASLLAMGLTLHLVPSAHPARQGGPAGPASRAPSDSGGRRLGLLVLAYGLFGFGYVITATFISTIARMTPALHPVEPLVWLAVGLAAMPSVALWIAIARRIGNEAAFALACLAEALGVGLSVAGTSAPALLAAALLLGVTMMGITALGLVQARLISRADPRRSLALMTAAFGLGQMLGPSFAGLTYDLTGSFRAPSLAAAGALVLAALLVGWPHGHRGQAREG